MTKLPLPALNDPEAARIPERVPLVLDAHVHLFPDQMFAAIWQWFEQFAWPIRYRFSAEQVVEFLLDRGICHLVCLHYAHKPGIARELNKHMAHLSRRFSQITGTATVFPGEQEAGTILEEAFELGLHGVKLHGHVQCFPLDSQDMHRIYELCEEHQEPLVMHVGRAPKSPAFQYPRDPYSLYSAEAFENILRNYPNVRFCVPHLGADEFTGYRRLVERYDNLWLDIAMTLAGYFPGLEPPSLAEMRPDRIMYGTDFPHLPYAWDRELTRLLAQDLPDDILELILWRNAAEFFSISLQS